MKIIYELGLKFAQIYLLAGLLSTKLASIDE